jgi:hypothetical protein
MAGYKDKIEAIYNESLGDRFKSLFGGKPAPKPVPKPAPVPPTAKPVPAAPVPKPAPVAPKPAPVAPVPPTAKPAVSAPAVPKPAAKLKLPKSMEELIGEIGNLKNIQTTEYGKVAYDYASSVFKSFKNTAQIDEYIKTITNSAATKDDVEKKKILLDIIEKAKIARKLLVKANPFAGGLKK